MPEPLDWEEDLLATLASAFATPSAEAPAATISAIRRAAVAHKTARSRARRTVALRWRRHPWIVGGAVVSTFVVGSGTAFAVGAPVPPVVRDLATAIGLPVKPQSVVDVQNAVTALQQQLQSPAPNRTDTATAARQLSSMYQQLDPTQRAQVGTPPRPVLQQACRYVFPAAGASGSGPNGSAGEPGRGGARGSVPDWAGCRPPQAGQRAGETSQPGSPGPQGTTSTGDGASGGSTTQHGNPPDGTAGGSGSQGGSSGTAGVGTGQNTGGTGTSGGVGRGGDGSGRSGDGPGTGRRSGSGTTRNGQPGTGSSGSDSFGAFGGGPGGAQTTGGTASDGQGAGTGSR